MRKIGAFEAKTNLSKLLSDVENRKEEIIIQKRGINIAVLIPFEEFSRKEWVDKKKAILEGCRAVRGSQEGLGDILSSALRHKLSAYDASYFRLTEERGIDLISQDPDLLTLRRESPWIKSLDDIIS